MKDKTFTEQELRQVINSMPGEFIIKCEFAEKNDASQIGTRKKGGPK